MRANFIIILFTLCFLKPAYGQQDNVWDSFDLKLFQKRGNYGVKSIDNDIIIPAKYLKIKIYTDGYIVTENLNNQYKIFNIKKNTFFNTEYSYVGSFDLRSNREELFQHNICQIANDSNKMGLIDSRGETTLLPQYEFIGEYTEGLAVVHQNFKTGYIDTLGEIIIPIKYDYSSEEFKNGLVRMLKNGKVGYLNLKGEIIIPFEYDQKTNINTFNNGLIALKKNDKYGYLDNNGIAKTEFIYDDAYNFSENLGCVMLNGKIGFIDTNGKTIIPFEYDGNVLREFHDGIVAVLKKNNSDSLKSPLKVGFINMKK